MCFILYFLDVLKSDTCTVYISWWWILDVWQVKGYDKVTLNGKNVHISFCENWWGGSKVERSDLISLLPFFNTLWLPSFTRWFLWCKCICTEKTTTLCQMTSNDHRYRSWKSFLLFWISVCHIWCHLLTKILY